MEDPAKDAKDVKRSRAMHINSLCKAKLREMMGLHKVFPSYYAFKNKKDLGLDKKDQSKRKAIPGHATKPPAGALPLCWPLRWPFSSAVSRQKRGASQPTPGPSNKKTRREV